MTWFEELTGVEERSPESVRRDLSIDGDELVCPGGRRIACGRLELPKLSELREVVSGFGISPRPSTIHESVGDARQLHADAGNANALVQVASQFNLLEMTGPSITPERGVGIYERDPTQGPACAIACGAGTIYRNYFAKVGDAIGQSANQQIDCSAELGEMLGNQNGILWRMENGYLFPTDAGLREITDRLEKSNDLELDELRGELRIGLQWQAAVTLPGATHRVSQAYCSALPVDYGSQPTKEWTSFARLILEAAYEATLLAAAVNASRSNVNLVYLTLLGGGVFGNWDKWIFGAIERAFKKTKDFGLEVRIVSYRRPKRGVTELVKRIGAKQ